jgi:hypothetical protein
LWPVCPASEASAHVKGAALTYARRYALFTLVGIAGEDDLDAPDIPRKELSSPDRTPPRRSGNGIAHAPPLRDGKGSESLRDRLVAEIAEIKGEDALAVWAKRALSLKNELTVGDARSVEAAYLAQLDGTPEVPIAPSTGAADTAGSPPQPGSMAATEVTPLTKPIRRRSKAHLAVVASQPCLVCKRVPCDAHHLKMAQPRSLGRKVSDEFTVPLCRRHHRELHQHGNERAWWQNQGIDPMPVAAALWEKARLPSTNDLTHERPPDPLPMFNGKAATNREGLLSNSETKPILAQEME